MMRSAAPLTSLVLAKVCPPVSRAKFYVDGHAGQPVEHLLHLRTNDAQPIEDGRVEAGTSATTIISIVRAGPWYAQSDPVRRFPRRLPP